MKRSNHPKFSGSPLKAQRISARTLRFLLVSLCLLALGAGIRLWSGSLLPVGAAQEGKQSNDGVWQEMERASTADQISQASQGNQKESGVPAGARTLRLDRAALERVLGRAPMEFTSDLKQSQTILTLPMPDGSFARFRIEESPILEPALAAQYPEIKSYRGQGIDDPVMTMRCDWTPRGFHALVVSGGQTISIHPASTPARDDDVTTYVSYSAQDIRQAAHCEFDGSQFAPSAEALAPNRPNFSYGSTLRTYRIAIATTQEYTNDPQLGGGTVAGAIASLNTWVSAVNAIYERELAIRLILVTNNALIFTAEPDGFTNGTPGTMLDEVRPKLRDVIGPANYDLGHVMGTGNGGVAGLGVVCNNGPNDPLGPSKGRGATGVTAPVGNPAYVGVFSHEIGHQFGASHSFNGTVAGCSARSAGTSYESGSGTTIMSYQGSCQADDIEGSQLRFHAGSINEIVSYLGGAGGTCGTPIATGNNPPTVSGGPDYTIPRNTPFTLTATGTDPDVGDLASLTYVWEQVDVGGALYAQNGTPASYTDAGDPATTTRPIFRPFAPTVSPARTFPSLTYILNNANTPPDVVNGFKTAEQLPRVGRALNFRVTLRDNRAGGGGVNDDLVTLTVDGNTGPFLVTAPNTATAWTVGSQQTVTWSINNTNAAPINCANVRITLSTDGGQTFPVVLAASTPNNGSATVTVPNGLSTTTARVKVEAIGNIFFDISDVNFSINAGMGCPQVNLLQPGANNIGGSITLTGSGFTGVTAVKFSNNVAAAFTVNSDTQITATVPAGAVTGPVTLSKNACQDVPTINFIVCANPPTTLQVDDGTPNTAFGGAQPTYFVNRLTPAVYPATLNRVSLRFDAIQNVPPGTNLTVVVGANLAGGQTINNTVFQMVNATVGPLGQFTDYAVAPLTIAAGDFVVGYLITPPPASFAGNVDSTTPQNRSYISGSGVTFTLDNTRNWMIRAQYLTGCGGGATCPTVNGINPASGMAGSTVTITGTNFTGVTGVKFSNNVNAFFTVNSDTQITATVPAGAVTGPITLSRPTCPDVQTASFTVNNLICPTVNGLNPMTGQSGSTITITGTGFTGVSVVKFSNENSTTFTVNSDTQITATVPAGVVTGPITLSRTGCPTVQTATFTPCNVSLPLQIDDSGLETAAGGTYFVNRLTPVAYPATLNRVSLQFASFQNVPAGTNLTIIVGANPAGGQTINNTVFQSVNAMAGAVGQFTDYAVAPLTITAGDFVVGFQMTAPNTFPGLADTTAPQNRSYTSGDGVTFALDNGRNWMIRAQYLLGCPGNCATPPANLATWLPGEGNATDVQGTNHGVLRNGAAFAPGKVGQAFSFNGAGAYVQLPDNFFPFPGTTPFSFDAWFKTSTGGVIFGQQSTDPVNIPNGHVPGIYVGTDGKLRVLVFWNGGAGLMTSPAAVNDGAFHHVAVSYDGTMERVYLDGALFGNQNHTQVGYSPIYKYQLGTGYTVGWPSGNNGWFPFNGLIDEVDLFSRALSAAEVQTIFNAGSAGKCRSNCVTPPANLATWLPGDGNTSDIQGNLAGITSNAVTFASGKVAQAFSFDGTASFVELPSRNLGQNYSVEFWLNPARSGYYQHVISNSYASPNFGAFYYDEGTLTLWANSNQVLRSSAVPLNQWTHAALTYDGNVVRLYLNGVLDKTSGQVALSFNNPVRLGDGINRDSSRVFQGLLDEVSFYSRALTLPEVQSIFNTGITGKCKPVTPPGPNLAIGNTQTPEGNAPGNARGNLSKTFAEFTVTLTGVLGFTQPITVHYETADGTATAPNDYTATSGTLVFNPPFTQDEVSQTISVEVFGDDSSEPDQDFFVILSDSVNALIGDDRGECTILDDDCAASALFPLSQSFAAAGGSGEFIVEAAGEDQAACALHPTSNDNWLTVTSISIAGGTGTFGYNVAANPSSSARSGTITVGGLTHTVNQLGSTCTYTLNPTSTNNVAAAGANGLSFAVTTNPATGCAFTATTNDNWITITNANSSPVTFNVAANPNMAPRTGTITAGGQTHTVTQTAAFCPTVTVGPIQPGLPAGTIGTAYTQPLTQTGGAGTPTWSTSDGTLPGGLTLNPATGVLSGMPTMQGLFIFTIRATVAPGCFGQRQYTLNVNSNGLQFYPLAVPMRLLDTRPGKSPDACSQPNAPIAGGTSRTQLARGICNIPAGARAITGNITTVVSGGGYLTLYPSDAMQPLVASSNYQANQIINNVFTVGLGNADGAFKIFALNTTDVVVDVTGYYAPPGMGGLYFHPLPKPIRLLETRPGEMGCNTPGLPLQGGQDSPQQARLSCNGVTIPATALAIVGNATTVGPQGQGYLTLFPGNATRPLVASSNYLAGKTVNGPFTVGLSPTGIFNIFTVATTHLVVDVLGYYSPEANDANGVGLLFNPLPKPVRLLETRVGLTGCITPGAPIIGGVEQTQSARGACQGETIAATALAVVGNATVVNAQGGYLTLWPSNIARPLVATSNFAAGQTVNRHFIVGLGTMDGAFKIYSSLTTDLVIDVSGYFAP